MNTPYTNSTPFPNNYAQRQLVLARGRGSYLYDRAGKRYLDFSSGIAVNALGHANRRIARRVGRQMRRLVHVSNLFTTPPALDLGTRLLQLATTTGREPFGAVHFGSSGTEANEAALKYARLYAHTTRGEGHATLISFTNAFHGRTMGALSVTPKEAYRRKFEPLLPGCVTVPFNDPEALKQALSPQCAAVIVEVVQGEGGLQRLSPDMVTTLNEETARHGVLLIADEVQTGLGRLGGLFGSHVVGLTPDIITLAKPLAGGLPLSATLIPERINAHVQPGDHGTTFGGGPVTTAAAGVVLDEITRHGFLDSVVEKGRYLSTLLEELATAHPCIAELRGIGLLRGVALDDKQFSTSQVAEVIEEAQEQGLLILRSGTAVLRFAPPLTVTRSDLTHGVEILSKTLTVIQGRRRA